MAHVVISLTNRTRDRIHILWTHRGLHGFGSIPVVLKSPAERVRAIQELDGAALFGKRVQVHKCAARHEDALTEPYLRWGWYANRSSAIEDIRLRYPPTSRPHGIFDPYKEGRVVTFFGFPADNSFRFQTKQWLYSNLHTYNALALSEMVFYKRRSLHRQLRSFIHCIFETKEVAETVSGLFDGSVAFGEKLKVAKTTPSMKYLGSSWDSGHNRAHGQPRDFGMANDSNFESVSSSSLTSTIKLSLHILTRHVCSGLPFNRVAQTKVTNLNQMQDEVYRKFLLGPEDRGLWVPGHKY